VTDQYAPAKRILNQNVGSSTFGAFRWFVVVVIWVGIGRITEFVPLIRGVPLAKIAIALAFIAYWVGGTRTATRVPILASDFGRTAAVLALIAVASLTFSVWRSQTLRSIIDSIAVGAEFWLIFKASSDWPSVRRLLGAIAAATGALAITAVATYSGGRAEVHSSYDTNDLAYVIVTVLPISYAAALTSRGFVRRSWYALCAIFAITVLLTGSRGGAIGLAVVILFQVFSTATGPPAAKRTKFRRNVLVALTVLLVVGAITWPLLPAQTRERLHSLTDLSSDYNVQLGKGKGDSRTDIWIRGMSSLVKRPIGFGMGAFEAVDGMTGGQYRAPHNSEVQIAVELGFLGLFLYLRMYRLSWLALGKMVAERRALGAAAEGEALERGIFAANLKVSLIGNFVAGFFLSQAYSNLIWILFALIAGLAAAFVPSETSAPLRR
jgi:O-antigen ligase